MRPLTIRTPRAAPGRSRGTRPSLAHGSRRSTQVRGSPEVPDSCRSRLASGHPAAPLLPACSPTFPLLPLSEVGARITVGAGQLSTRLLSFEASGVSWRTRATGLTGCREPGLQWSESNRCSTFHIGPSLDGFLRGIGRRSRAAHRRCPWLVVTTTPSSSVPPRFRPGTAVDGPRDFVWRGRRYTVCAVLDSAGAPGLVARGRRPAHPAARPAEPAAPGLAGRGPPAVRGGRGVRPRPRRRPLAPAASPRLTCA